MTSDQGRRRSNRPLSTPAVSLWSDANKSLVLNRAAYEALGQPECVLVLWDAAERCLGFRPASVDDPRAYRVNPAPSAGYRIAGRAFRRRYGIDALPTGRYAATMVDGDLVVCLTSANV